MKKKLTVILTTVLVIAACFAVSGYVWASSTGSEKYIATSVKKVHMGSPIVYELESKEGYQMCYTCGAWESFCMKNSIEFENSGAYYSKFNVSNGVATKLHDYYHNYIIGDEERGNTGVNPVTTKVYLKQDLYEVTGLKPAN